MTIKKTNISIDSLLVQPYDPSSRVANSYPGFIYFSKRHDFILFGKMRGIALALTATNLTFATSRHRTAHGSFRADLVNVDTNETVTSRSFTLRIDSATEAVTERIDLILKSDMVDPTCSYIVEIRDTESDELEVSTPILFYRYERLPHGYFRRLNASLSVDGVDYCNIPCDSDTSLQLKFGFESTYPSNLRMPEFTFRYVNGDGKQFDAQCSVVQKPDFVVSTQIDEGLCGIVYGEVCLFGHAIASVIFNADGASVSGRYSGDDCSAVRDYDRISGYDLWRERLNRAVGDEGAAARAMERAIKDGELAEEAEARRQLDMMVGLTSVRGKITTYANMTRLNVLRGKASLKVKPAMLHSMFLGSPGTGKTTVAKIMGKLLRGAGVLSKGHVVVRERSNLVGRYYDSTFENLRNAIEEAGGGILFIDEAYQLNVPEDPKDPGRDVIDGLLTLLADDTQRDIMVILAGYSEPMKRMFDMNPGLKSRIPESNFHHFEDFTAEELTEIAMRYFNANDFVLTEGARTKIETLLTSDYEARDEKFGNARHVVSLIETRIFPAMANRLAKIDEPTVEQLTTVTADDVPVPAPSLVIRQRRLGFAC